MEIAKSLGEVQTSASITGKTMLPNFVILYSQRASGLRKKLMRKLSNDSVSTEESEAQKKGGYLAGRQIAWLIHKTCKIRGESAAILDLGDLLNGRSQE